jgi:mannose-6-phosphate isomerase-like protein (cupin superfamily)
MDVRRVVTGHDADGKAVFASDELVAPLTMTMLPGSEFHRLWGGEEAPTFPDDGRQPDQPTYFPGVGGFRFGLFSVPPHTTVPAADVADMDAALAEVEEKMPGLLGHMEPDAPGMHTTDTIDFEYVISGSVTLELDDGAEVLLKAGDTVVQNGTRHAWRNNGSETCRLAVFIVGAHRKD